MKVWLAVLFSQAGNAVSTVRRFLVALGVAGFGLAACSASGSSTTATGSAHPAVPPVSVTTTTVVQREQIVPTRTRYVVEGRSVDLVCKGRGRIPVVFQAGGAAGGVIWTSGGIIPALGPNVFACVFDRPGVEYNTISPAAPAKEVLTPRTIETILVETLRQAHVGPRVILVGHSLGGMDAVMFGADYPNLVAGAVLLDPSGPADVTGPSNGPVVAFLGIAPDAAAAQVRAVKRWPSVPLVVLTEDFTKWVAMGISNPAEAREFRDWHRRYARLSSKGIEREVPDATHDAFVHAGVVENATLAAIRQVLRDAH